MHNEVKVACPTPHKIFFTSKHAAKVFVEKRKKDPNFGSVSIYRCSCSYYHFSRMDKQQSRAIKRKHPPGIKFTYAEEFMKLLAKK